MTEENIPAGVGTLDAIERFEDAVDALIDHHEQGVEAFKENGLDEFMASASPELTQAIQWSAQQRLTFEMSQNGGDNDASRNPAAFRSHFIANEAYNAATYPNEAEVLISRHQQATENRSQSMSDLGEFASPRIGGRDSSLTLNP